MLKLRFGDAAGALEAYEGGESQGLPLTLIAIFLMCIIAGAVLLTIYFTVGTGAITTTLGNYPQR